MKKVFVLSFFVIALMVGSVMAAEPIFYLDFDMKPDLVMTSGDLYSVNWDERATSVTGIYAENLGASATTFDIKVPDGDGVNLPDSAGPQGGKAMIIESGGFEEGFNIEMSGPYHPGDHTVEVCFWTANANLGGNTVGLQNIWCNDWPTGNAVQHTLRIIGDAGAVGRAEDNEHIEMVCWQPGGTSGDEKRISSINPITAQTWHTAQFVFDYNESDPANTTFYFYLDGVLQGSNTYDAAKTGPGGEYTQWFMPIWGTPASSTTSCREEIGAFRFGLGISSNRLINGSDHRGLQGAIDAFCISEGALSPAEFVLPTGYEFPAPPAPLSAGNWALYE